jgi:hypothetical protein
MTSRSAAEIAFGVMGVFFVANNLTSAVVSIAMIFHGSANRDDLRWIPVVGSAVSLAFGVALIALRRSLAAMLSPAAKPPEEENGTGGLMAPAIAVIGIYFFAEGVQGFLAELLMKSRAPFQASIEPPTMMVVGAALFLGARGLVVVWHKLRTAGRARD